MENRMMEEQQIRSILNMIDKLKDKASFKELEFSKQKRKYENICQMVLNCEILQFSNKNELIDKDLTQNLLFTIISDLFQVKDLDSFFKKIKTDHQIPSSEFDCVTVINEKDNLENILIWGYQCLSIIPNLAHEFIHAYYELGSIEELMNTQTNYHYHEIPAIATEQIVAYEAEKEMSLPFLSTMNALRISHIKQNLEIYQTMDKSFLQIKRDKYLEDIYRFQKHLTFTYTISDIYATALFQKYLEDKKTFLKLFNCCLKREITMADLLNYYQISLKNQETSNQYMKKIESVSK